jgi:hypothetical protein
MVTGWWGWERQRWAVACRQLGVGGGVGEREGGEEIMAILLRVSPLPCVHRLEDKGNKRRRKCHQGRERWPARVAPWSILQREKEREKRRRRNKEFGRNLFEF